VREVRIVGGSSTDSLVRAWRASDGSAEEIPGTRILRERSSPQAVTVA